MSVPEEPPRWQALPIGPGGLPAAEVRPSGPGAPWVAGPPAFGLRPQPAERRPINKKWMTAGIIVAGFALVVALALWVNSASPLGRAVAANVAVGDCLASSGRQISGVVNCASTQADFSVVGRYPQSSDGTDCSATPSDVVVVGTGPTVLCLDYIAAIGQCLYAGDNSTGVGKVSCDSTDTGLLRVTAVLSNTIDPSGCPTGTTDHLVHRHSSQVICLTAK